MADVLITQDEFERLTTLVARGESARNELIRLTTLARPISRYDLTSGAVAEFYAAVDAAKGIEAREVKNADQPRTQTVKKRRA